MTDSDDCRESRLLKTDALGRVRTSTSQREALLDAFEEGALSGPDFARVHGINYQTFATWRQKRKRQRGEYPNCSSKSIDAETHFALVEAVSSEQTSGMPDCDSPSIGNADAKLQIELPGGATMILSDSSQTEMAVELIRKLSSSTC